MDFSATSRRCWARRWRIFAPGWSSRRSRKNRVGRLAGGGLLGFLIAELPGRGKKVVVHRIGRKSNAEGTVVKAGLLMTVVKLLFDIVRPALTKWLGRWVASYAGQRLWRRY